MRDAYLDRVVAFIDIIGFGSIIKALDEQPGLHEGIARTLRELKSFESMSQKEGFAYSELEISAFSDSIVLSGKPADAFSILWGAGWLQAELLKDGILLRGGIARGKTFHEGGILYGEGMLKAYNLEKSTAFYPRVVIDPDYAEDLPLPDRKREMLLSRDADDLWIVDPFKFNAFIGTDDDAADGWDLREFYFDEVSKKIDEGGIGICFWQR